jgi:hypothetical protein
VIVSYSFEFIDNFFEILTRLSQILFLVIIDSLIIGSEKILGVYSLESFIICFNLFTMLVSKFSS